MIFSLKTHYELRKTTPLVWRLAQGRLFVKDGCWGVSDDSGTLWPLSVSEELGLVDGCWAQFRLSFEKSDGGAVSKYEDTGFVGTAHEVCSKVIPEGSLDGFLAWAVTDLGRRNAGHTHPATEIVSRREERGERRVHETYTSELSDAATPKELSGRISDGASPLQTHFFPNDLARKKSALQKVEKAFAAAERHFQSRGFLRTHTPLLVPSGGVDRYIVPFRTEYTDHKGKVHSLELPTSPEFALKKLLIQGHSKVFDLVKSFRNVGELSKTHEPEFWMLEWYRSGEDMTSVQRDTQELVGMLSQELGSTLQIPKVWPVISLPTAFREHAGLDLNLLQEVAVFRREAAKVCPSIAEQDDWDTVFSKVMMEVIEPRLPFACFIEKFPIQMGALAEASVEESQGAQSQKSVFVQRFEAYLGGIEICNGYQELSSGKELAERFQEIQNLRAEEGHSVMRDPVFEKHMHWGLPKSCGNALGMERVLALLVGEENLQSLKPISFLPQFPKGHVADR